MGHTILIVDDEKSVLLALANIFAEEEDISVVTADRGQAALKLMAERPVDLLVSDQIMPQMDGLSLLDEARRKFPDVAQILVTDSDDLTSEDVLEQLGREVAIVHKPWDAEQLRATIRRTLESRVQEAERATLIEHAHATPAQLDRAERIRKRLQQDKPLGEILIDQGALTRQDYNQALRVRRSRMSVVELLQQDGHLSTEGLASYREIRQEAPGESDQQILVGEKLVTEEQFLQALCQKHDVPFVEPEVGIVDTRLLSKTSTRYLFRQKALPVRILNERLIVIFSDPLDDVRHAELQRIYGVPLEISCSTETKITEALVTLERLRGESGESGEDQSIEYHELQEITSGEETGEEAKQIVDYLLVRSVQLGASDLHIEPQQARIRVRVRVDGVLQHLTDLPADFAPRVVSRVKILAGADIAERRLHQDGRIFIKVEGREIDIRVSTYVTTFGETIVMRLLDRNKGLLPLDKIGFEPRVASSIDNVVLQTSSGLVLITGPTGSGKTTTLYSFVDHCNDPAEKVITCEDPVEFVLDGLVQCSVNSKTGPTFNDSLRAIVRQDPDTIVVGEIRDHVTASLALESALTGHKVFSTFHTEDAVGAFVRLLEMKMEPFLVASTVSAVLAQRLVRRICSKCRKPGTPSRPQLRFLNLERTQLKDIEIWEAGGCAACEGSGYKGRLGVHEALLPDDDFRDAVLQKAPAKILRQQARQLPEFMTLQENGLLKVAAGLTTLDEVVSNLPRDTGARSISELLTLGKIGRFA